MPYRFCVLTVLLALHRRLIGVHDLIIDSAPPLVWRRANPDATIRHAPVYSPRPRFVGLSRPPTHPLDPWDPGSRDRRVLESQTPEEPLRGWASGPPPFASLVEPVGGLVLTWEDFEEQS